MGKWLATDLTTAALVATAVAATAEPRLNEFLALNQTVLADEDGQFSDWIELHNPGPGSVDLAGWRLTDDATAPDKWTIPSVSVPAGGFQLVWASGKNRAVAGAPLHTNFALSGAGEFLALIRPDGSVAQEFAPQFPPQSPDRSYGLGGEVVGFFTTPTPGAPNGAISFAGLVADTKFSHDRGFYTSAIALTLTTATPGATIRFTTNGSRPTATAGQVFTAPIAITTTTVVRAAAFKPGYEPSNIDTHTYIFPERVIRQPATAPAGWPTGSVNGQRLDYAMDARIVDHADPSIGGTTRVLDGLAALPTLSIALPQSDFTGSSQGIYVNAQQRGDAWERAVSVEMIDAAGREEFHAGAGMRIRGNFSRDGNNPKHSFRLLFRAEYGDATLRYPLFGDGGAEVFDALDVQSPQDFSWAFYDPEMCNYMRDTWARDTQAALGQPHARSRWIHLFINGVYWGIYQIEERPESRFAASYLGGDDDQYDVIKNTGFSEDFRIEATDGVLVGPSGQPSAWERLFAACRGHFAAPAESKFFALQGLMPDGRTPDPTPDAALLDADNLADYLLMVMFSANTDMASSIWVGQKPNNFYGARRRGGTRGFVWVAHDGETSLDYYDASYDRTGPVTGAIRNEFVYSNPEFFHNDLLPSLEWRTRFGDRAHRALFNGGALTPDRCQARLDARAAELDRAIVAESARWGDAQRASAPFTKIDWLGKVADTRTWLADRRDYFLAQLRADGLYPAEDAPVFSQHGGELTTGQRLTFGGASAPIWYTMDGSDPRLVGGEMNPDALPYTGGTSEVSTLISAGSVWAYHDRGEAPVGAWTELDFDDSAWKSGPAPLGYGDGDEATRIEDNATPGYASADTDRFITSWFRRRFHVDDPADIHSLTLDLQRDDGAVVYLNGQEIWRTNMPGTGDILPTTTAPTAATGADEATYFSRSVPPARLVAGPNVVAVEVHQNAADSSDVSFDLSLIAARTSGAQEITLPPGRVRLHARARSAVGAWSALTSADFLVGARFATAANLVISEIMYHPADPDAEFIEIQNRGSQPVDLRGVSLAGAVRFTFPESSPLLEAGGRTVVVRQFAAFSTNHPTAPPPAGEFDGNLDNSGETLRLRAPDGTLLHQVSFQDQLPWPAGTDGEGRSLSLAHADAKPADPASWRPSASVGGTPGLDDTITLAAWMTTHGLANPNDDLDGDALVNFAEYALGTDPRRASSSPIAASFTPDALILTLTSPLAASQSRVLPESAHSLDSWLPAGELIRADPLPDGSFVRSWRFPRSDPRQFVRLRFQAP